MDWKELRTRARKALEAGNVEEAARLTAQARAAKALAELGGDEEEAATPAAEQEGISAKMDQILAIMQAAPISRDAGYYSDEGGSADPEAKSLGDFLLAVKRGDTQRLARVYQTTKTMTEGAGASGGYLVPREFDARLLQAAQEASAIVAAVERIPVETPSGDMPALDTFTAPTAGSGNTAMAGGLVGTKREEGGDYDATEPDFEMVHWQVTDAISGVIPVSKELNADSPQSIEALLRRLIGIADANKQEYFILRGNGVGEPLGILNAPAAIGISPDTDNTFAYEDALEMVSRFKPVGNGQGARWYMHRSTLPDLGAFEAGTGGAVWQANLQSGVNIPLLGYPIVYSEHLPQANSAGHALLADLSAYLVFDRGGLEISYSEHAYFTSGRVAWRFSRRMDGKPWQKGPITLADPQGSYTVSPFVYFND